VGDCVNVILVSRQWLRCTWLTDRTIKIPHQRQ